MPVETADDREIMLADFGDTVLYTPVGGTQVSIVGIFDNAYEAVDAGGNVPVALTQPHVLCRTADVSAAQEGDEMVINSVTYVVRVIMGDGTGFTDIMLERQ